MKILHTADWHLGTFRSPVKDGVNLRTEDTKRCLDELVRVAEEERPDYSLVSGDIFHVDKIMSDRCCAEIVTAANYIRELASVSGQVVIMRGTPNHDGRGPFNVLKETFSGFSNVHIVTEPQVLAFADADIAALPGFDSGIYRTKFPGLSKEEENEAVTGELSNIILGMRAQCRPDKKSVLMAHYTVPGCNTESGQVMALTQFEPVIPQETLLSADYDLVALGHIHRPQMVGADPWYYSGAINALNFGDEGQERGFWVHRSLPFGGWDSVFHKTPSREFITFHFTDADITEINLGHMDEVAINYWRYNGAVQDRIVRIHYTCTAENEKAYKMKNALMEKALLEDGAFMLWENLPDKVEGPVNRTKLADTTDPEINLVKYLEEKQAPPEKIQEPVSKARPVMAEAQAGMTMAANAGVFEPIEISVKNYRNYEEETFRFDDISFCTINGPNGAGKSSLFMDAIIDCLYEKPREGVIKDNTGKSPWIRNDEKARAGAIMFIFRIGGKKYRVTRTRARSGKGTLNLAEYVDNEWRDRSRERYEETQKKITDIIGMDSLTFKSCVLIMQDQYGLFLQAKPEERVEVLSTLLGLGIYQAMEKIASDKEKGFRAESSGAEREIEIYSNTADGLGKPQEELALCQETLEGYETGLKEKTAERDEKKLLLDSRQEASRRREKLLAAVEALQEKRALAEQNMDSHQEIADSSKALLDCRTEIEGKAAEHNALAEREKELAVESALYSSKKAGAEKLRQQADAEQKSIDSMKKQVSEKERELEALQPAEQDAVIREKAAEYELTKKLLDEAYETERSYRGLERELTKKKHAMQQLSAQYEADVRSMRVSEDGYRKKAELLLNVECVDISNAKCGFLADAVSAKELLESYLEQYAERKKLYEEKITPLDAEITDLEKRMEETGYHADSIPALSKQAAALKPYVTKLEALNQREGRIALIKAGISNLQSNIQEAEKRLSEVKIEASAAELERDKYKKAFEEYALVQESILLLKPWMEKEKQLPVAEERNAAALKRIQELTAEIAGIDTEIAEKQAEAEKEGLAVDGMEELAEEVSLLDAEIEMLNSRIKSQQKAAGALEQKAEQIKELQEKIAVLQEKQAGYAKEMSDYETLKTAFSQSGVPHQIIRSIIQNLTDTANAILGQMTGGKMGVEFRLERLMKKKEKGTLDIFVEEYGKPGLPYLSRSGGEKVKSSLAVILALAEMKSSLAGIQLGFLQIDEPPFLDSDGTQAYVDALEAIRQRYPGLKVMAITHDQEFKARFPQSITVYKDEHGSHVKWD